MNDHKKEETMLPDWMCSGETYVPSKDKEAFLTKSTNQFYLCLQKWDFMKGRIADFLLLLSEIVLYTSVYCSYCMFGKLSVYSDRVQQ